MVTSCKYRVLERLTSHSSDENPPLIPSGQSEGFWSRRLLRDVLNFWSRLTCSSHSSHGCLTAAVMTIISPRHGYYFTPLRVIYYQTFHRWMFVFKREMWGKWGDHVDIIFTEGKNVDFNTSRDVETSHPSLDSYIGPPTDGTAD